MFQTDDVRINKVKELLPPVAVLEKFPATETASTTTFECRNAIHNILEGKDDRLLVIVGPCSIHDPEAAVEYGKKLKVLRDELGEQLEVVMRVYFEKPRTTVGWKGLINDPYLNDTYKLNDGLRIGRKLLLDLTDMGLPTASEFLDMITPQYVADLISWGRLVLVQQSLRFTVSLRLVCLALLALKTVQMATSRSQVMQSVRQAHLTISCQSLSTVILLSLKRQVTLIATLFCVVVRSQTIAHLM